MKNRISSILLIALCISVSSLAQNTNRVFVKARYFIKAGDTLSITVANGASLMSTHAIVRDDGKIPFPQLGSVPADGLTTPELKTILEGRLSEFAGNAVAVTVQVEK